MPAGPDNLMGHHAIRLAAYGGVYLSARNECGFWDRDARQLRCIRLRDDDIKTLYRVIAPGTKVNIINTPIKVSEELVASVWLRSTSRYRKTLMTIRRRCRLI